ncbi:MAG: hypothetical protein VYB65_13035 [Myxococcota bacterium]|nr:hypothetical protein [Myxococcota bacterium]
MLIKSLKLLVFSALFAAAPAVAQDVVQEEDTVSYRKKTSIDFSDVNISGELTKPEGAYVGVRKNIKFKNFIKVRANFRDKLSDSVDNI